MDTHKLLNYTHKKLQQLLDFIFPPQCGGCRRSGTVLCTSCTAQFIPIHPPFCQHCNSPLPADKNCQHRHYHKPHLTGLRAAYEFKEPLRSCIHNLKYQGNVRLASPLGLLLARAYRASNIQADIIIPVPLHPERERERGYNQAYLLAKVCAQAIGVPLNTSILQRRRATQKQTQLAPHQRFSNVAEAFCCSSPIATKGLLERKVVVIIDDVSTTGATLEACAAPLFAAGASEVWGLVLAQRL